MSSEALKAAIEAVEAANPAIETEPVQGDQPDGTTDDTSDEGQRQPAESVSESKPDEDTSDSEDAAASNGKGDPAQRQNKGVGKRINELTREKYEAIRRAEAAERRAMELEQHRQTHVKPTGPAQSDETEPTLEQFEFDQVAYMRALARWEYRQEHKQAEQVEQQRRQQEVGEQKRQEFVARVGAFEAKNPGKWEAATKAPINYTQPMLEVIAASDAGPDIAVYLAENLDQADAISRMTPYAAAAALGRIEASFGALAASSPPSPPKNITKAPPPPSTVQGGSVVRKDLASMDVADHLEAVRAKRNR